MNIKLTKEMNAQEILAAFEELGFYIPRDHIRSHVRILEVDKAIVQAKEDGLPSFNQYIKRSQAAAKEYVMERVNRIKQNGQF